MKHYLPSLALLAMIAFAVSHGREEPQQPVKKDQATPTKTADKADAAKDTAKDAAKPAKTKVAKQPLKQEVTLKGTFEAENMVEISLRPETWSGFTVLKAMEHGTPVKKGEQLVQLDLERIDTAIRELEMEQQLSGLALKQAEEEMPIFEKAHPLDLQAAERTKKIADEDMKRYEEFDRPMMVEMTDFMLRNARNFLDYAKEELKQLQKMYKSGDIREETEEIILKRQKHQVESQEFMLRNNERRRELILREMPRQEQQVRDMAIKASLALERAKITYPIGMNQKKLSLEKQRYDRQKSLERMKKLKKDREMMELQAPTDGIVYYGRCVRGQWQTSSRLTRGSSIMSDDVFMTIVKPGGLFIRTTVDEANIPHVKVGMAGRCTPTAYPDVKLGSKVLDIASVPLSTGSFEAKLSVDLGDKAPGVVAGMGCSVKITTYQKKDALVLPASAVFSEEEDEDKKYVFKIGADGKSEKARVTVGKTIGSQTEILGGLKEGDEVSPEKPKDEKKP